jgi:diguanylate cyclase
MTLDPRTLFFSMWLTVSLTILALLVGVGWTRAGRGLRAWTLALMLQSLGWALLMAWLGVLLLRPRPGSLGRGRWRWLAAAGVLASAPLVLARVALVIWAPEQYPSFESPHGLNVVGLMVNGACLGIGTLAFLMAHRDEAEAQLALLATQDPLTGLLNRRALMEQGERLVQLARRQAVPLTLMMFDIDHFKRINDERGHPVGDRVIAHFAAALHNTLREGDVLGRYGGEEFLAVLYAAGLDTAAAVDARLRCWLGDNEAALGFPVNYSAGAAGLSADGDSLESAIARADEALYRAKQAGRGRLVMADGR